MATLNTDIGFEVLAQAKKVKVSRFSIRIRIMHWFNAAMIITLYYLGFSQLFELSEMNFLGIPDTRPTHFQVGQIWVGGIHEAL